ncbi:MAG TPA: 2OG-Fe(II) oxygenase, partial [Byssovorax sp.]
TRAFCLPLDQREAGAPAAHAVVVARDGRLLGRAPITVDAAGAAAAVELARGLAPFDALAPPNAPVLVLPEALPPELCRELLAAFAAGVKVEGKVIGLRDGATTAVVEPALKSRTDVRLDGALRDRVWRELMLRVAPAVRDAFRFEITRFEYMQIGRYDGAALDHFGPHRDDARIGTRHRRFAMTLNLSDDYDGGELCFPAYDVALRPPPGAAVMFSCSLLHEAKPVTRGERFVLVGMFYGEGQVAESERSRAALAAPAPISQASGTSPGARRMQLLGRSAALLRELAGDVAALGDHIDGPSAAATRVTERVGIIHRAIAQLRDEVRALEAPYLAAQAERLGLAGARALKLHLGAGPHAIPGWLNVDARGGDLRADLRWPLPFADGAARFVFAAHVLEHFYRDLEVPGVLCELHRVLEPGGALRLVVPDLEAYLRAYATGDAAFFEGRRAAWPVGARAPTHLDQFLAYAGANQPLELFDTHKYGYDFETLAAALREAGFSQITRSAFMQSEHPELRVDDHSDKAPVAEGTYSLFVEATR